MEETHFISNHEITKEHTEFREKVKKDLLFRVFRELAAMKGNPRSQIFVAHGFLELLIHTIIKAKAKNGRKISKDSRTYSYAVQLVVLNEMGELSDDDFKIYEWFRKLRNTAAHEPLFQLSTDDLQNLNDGFRNVEDFHAVCQDLMLRLWNKNTEILLPIFVPSLAEKTKQKGNNDASLPSP